MAFFFFVSEQVYWECYMALISPWGMDMEGRLLQPSLGDPEDSLNEKGTNRSRSSTQTK